MRGFRFQPGGVGVRMGVALVVLAGLWGLESAAQDENATEGTSEPAAAFDPGHRPQFAVASPVLPRAIRIYGCDIAGPGGSESALAQAAPFEVTVYFECLNGAPESLEEDFVLALDGMDIARAPVNRTDLEPGMGFRETFRGYVPRNTRLGEHELRGGFVRDGSRGHSLREPLSGRMAALATVTVEGSAPLEVLPDAERAKLWEPYDQYESQNLLENGGFEGGFQSWRVDENKREGKGGWSRVLRLGIDLEVCVEGRNALRVIFAGGHDPNFTGPTQTVQVKPKTKYTVAYFIRSENVTSHQGVTVSVRSPGLTPQQFFTAPPESERFTGTHGWRRVAFEFETLPTMRQVDIRVRRFGSGESRYAPELYGPIGGTVWLDGLQVYETPAP